MIRFGNECVGCPPEMGCLGSCCPNRNVPHIYCDDCKDDVEAVYEYEGSCLCQNCLLKQFRKITLEMVVEGEVE